MTLNRALEGIESRVEVTVLYEAHKENHNGTLLLGIRVLISRCSDKKRLIETGNQSLLMA